MRLRFDHSFIFRQAGQGLIESIIGGAVVMIAAFAMVEVTVQTGSINANSRTVTEFTALSHDLRAMIANESTCRLALGGPITYNGAVTSTTQQLTANPQPIVLYQPVAAGAVFLMDPSMAGANATNTQWGSWQILQMALQPDPGAASALNIHPMILYMKAQRATPGGVADRQMTSIRLSVKTDASNHIVSCAPLTYGTDLMPAQSCTIGQILSSNGTAVFCLTVRCIPPLYWDGTYDALGNVNCGFTLPPTTTTTTTTTSSTTTTSTTTTTLPMMTTTTLPMMTTTTLPMMTTTTLPMMTTTTLLGGCAGPMPPGPYVRCCSGTWSVPPPHPICVGTMWQWCGCGNIPEWAPLFTNTCVPIVGSC
jgi:hypothetical protein